MTLSYHIKTHPVSEPASVEEVKAHGRIDTDEEDALLEVYIKAAREQAEKYMGRAIMEQVWTIALDEWPTDWDGSLQLVYPPNVSVDEVRLYDQEGGSSVVDDSNYWLDDISEPGRIYLTEGCLSTVIPTRDWKGIQVDFTCGYGDEIADVPATIRTGIWQAVVDMYQTRNMELSEKAKKYLNSYRILEV